MAFFSKWTNESSSTLKYRVPRRPKKLRNHGAMMFRSMINMQDRVKLPPGEDRDEWLACYTIEHFNTANLLFDLVSEFCTETTCPQMAAGPKVTYFWADNNKVKPYSLPACKYIEKLIEWVHVQINDPKIFPEYTNIFGKEFFPAVSKIFTRLFRVYAHIYHHHWEKVQSLGAEAHINTCFKEFYWFVKEFDLVKEYDMSPMRSLIEKLDTNPRPVGKPPVIIIRDRVSHVGNDIVKSFDNPDYFPDLDLTFVYQPQDGKQDENVQETVTLKVHRCILASRSPGLRDFLKIHVGEKAITIYSKFPIDINVAFIKYLYSDKLDRQYMNNPQMCELAEKYHVERLAHLSSSSSEKPPPSTINGDFVIALNTEAFPGDVRIVVDGRDVFAHKVFLCTRTEYFRAMIMGGMQESKTDTITLDDVDYNSFKATLHFIYTDKFPYTSDNNATINFRNENVDVNTALDVLPVASMLRMDSLVKFCEEVILKGVTTETVAYVWRIAKTYQIPNLQSHCEAQIKKEQWEVTQSPYWLSLTEEEKEEVICNLIKSDHNDTKTTTSQPT